MKNIIVKLTLMLMMTTGLKASVLKEGLGACIEESYFYDLVISIQNKDGEKFNSLMENYKCLITKPMEVEVLNIKEMRLPHNKALSIAKVRLYVEERPLIIYTFAASIQKE